MPELILAAATVWATLLVFGGGLLLLRARDALQRVLALDVLVVIIIAGFLFEWRTALISLLAIPLSLIAALVVLNLRDVPINVMVLAGLVVAMLLLAAAVVASVLVPGS